MGGRRRPLEGLAKQMLALGLGGLRFYNGYPRDIRPHDRETSSQACGERADSEDNHCDPAPRCETHSGATMFWHSWFNFVRGSNSAGLYMSPMNTRITRVTCNYFDAWGASLGCRFGCKSANFGWRNAFKKGQRRLSAHWEEIPRPLA